mgnify:CR=1 FL=1
MRQFKNIIFDLGGVLLDLDINRCMTEFEKVGLHDIRRWMTGTNELGFLKEYERGDLTTPQFREKIREEAGRALSDKETDRVWNSMLKEIPEYKLELLLTLRKKYRLYLLSNTNDLHWNVCIPKFEYRGLRVGDFFTHVFLSYQMHQAKPDIVIFQTVLKEAKLLPEETLFIDDSLENCRAAASLGINVFHYVPGDDLEMQLLNFID